MYLTFEQRAVFKLNAFIVRKVIIEPILNDDKMKRL